MLRRSISIDIDLLGPKALRFPRFLQKRLIRRRFKRYLERYRARWGRVILALRRLGLGPSAIDVRYSHKGVHIYIYLEKPIASHSNIAYAVRGALGDDPGRISRDLLRLARGMRVGMLIFSIKRGRRHEEPAPELRRLLLEVIREYLEL